VLAKNPKSRGGARPRPFRLLIRLWSIGVERERALQSRRIVWINQLALLGAAATSPYVLFYLIYDARLLPLAIINVVFTATYLSVLYVNHLGRNDWARNIGVATLYTQLFVSAAFLGIGAGIQLYYFTLSGVMYFIFSRTRTSGAAALVAVAAVLYLICHFTFDPGLVVLPDHVLNVMYVTSVTGAIGLSCAASYLIRREIDHSEKALARRADELRRTNAALLQSNLDLQQFAYIASHDLQSPLRSIGGFMQMLQAQCADRLNEEAQDWIRRTVQAVQRLQTLILDLLAYARVDAQDRPFQQLHFRAAFDDAVAMLHASIRDAGADVTCGELPIVIGDHSQLVQLLENLIENALKYHSDAPPRVHVRAEQQGNEWLLSVRDNGIGIDPKYHDRIYDIFRRLHNQQEYPGTGIGLAVCRRVVSRHGGRIWVDSEPGRGSCFYFTLPAVTVSTSSATGEGSHAASNERNAL
jgi:signal transduction histidine kinase